MLFSQIACMFFTGIPCIQECSVHNNSILYPVTRMHLHILCLRFLSNWSSSNALTNGTTPHLEDSTFDPHSPNRYANGKHPGKMLTRSKSEMRVKVRDVMATSLLDGKSPSTPPLRDRLSSAIRRSFRKKNKTPVLAFQECEDDFTFSQSPTSSPVLGKRSNTVSSFLYPHEQSDTDSTSTSAGTPSDISSQSPAIVHHPSIQVQGASGSSTAIANTASGGRESEGSGEEANGGMVRLREKEDKRSVSHCLHGCYNHTCISSCNHMHVHIKVCASMLTTS